MSTDVTVIPPVPEQMQDRLVEMVTAVLEQAGPKDDQTEEETDAQLQEYVTGIRKELLLPTKKVEILSWFCIGAGVVALKPGYGDQAVEKVAQWAGTHTSKIYEAINVFKFFRTPENLFAAMAKLEEAGRRPSWNALVPPSKNPRSPDHAHEQCSHLEEVGRRVEQVGMRVKTLLKEAPDKKVREEIKGTAFQLREAIAQSWNELDAILGDGTAEEKKSGDGKLSLAEAAERAQAAVLRARIEAVLPQLSERISEMAEILPTFTDYPEDWLTKPLVELTGALEEEESGKSLACFLRICEKRQINIRVLCEELEAI